MAEEQFKLATTYVQKNYGAKQYPDAKENGIADQLEYYGYFKQANLGDAADHPDKAPGFFDFKGKKKWAAWEAVKGMKKEEAMKKYVEKLTKWGPKWMEYPDLKK